jgi:putative ABC transport system permease protein
MAMFNLASLHEIDLLFRAGSDGDAVAEAARKLLIERHGTEDVTITTQQQMMDVLGDILAVLTAAVGALGGISLIVGAIGILTIMTIAVRERRGEIGLLRALGARRRQVLGLFVAEAVVLASLGGLAGLLIGAGGAQLIGLAAPDLPVHTPWQYVLAAEFGAAVIGLLAGGYPAWRAARLDPVEALRAE